MKGRTERTPEKRAAFLAALGETGNVTGSAEIAGIGRTTLYEWKAADEDFAQAWEATLCGPAADSLQDIAVARAKKSSDTLLIFLLKGLRPERFKDRHELTGANGGSVAFNMNLAKDD